VDHNAHHWGSRIPRLIKVTGRVNQGFYFRTDSGSDTGVWNVARNDADYPAHKRHDFLDSYYLMLLDAPLALALRELSLLIEVCPKLAPALRVRRPTLDHSQNSVEVMCLGLPILLAARLLYNSLMVEQTSAEAL
jgi:hypothetical protein